MQLNADIYSVGFRKKQTAFSIEFENAVFRHARYDGRVDLVFADEHALLCYMIIRVVVR